MERANNNGDDQSQLALVDRHGATRPRVIVVGAGFGGLAAARELARLPLDVLLLDRHNYHLFTPLLYQVATAGLEPEEIAHPVRSILRGLKLQFRVTEVVGIDLAKRLVKTRDGALGYDYLVLAAGSTNNYFGLQSVEASAGGLKDLEEALQLRNHILSRFETAAWEPDPERRAALLTFVVVGGGPTGVEFAGALSELITHVLPNDFPGLDFSPARVILVEAADRLVAMMHPSLQRAALDQVRSKGIQVRFNAALERIDGETLHFRDGSSLEAATVMWAAGVRAGDLARMIDSARGPAGRLLVSPTLQLQDHPEVFVIGDMAAETSASPPLPMVAPVAMQQGRCAAENIGHIIRGEPLRRFRYKDRGVMATIGRNQAVAQVGRLRFSGFIAWVLWLSLHIATLIGFRNRALVMINWIWNYFSYDRAVRLILGEREARATPSNGSRDLPAQDR